MKEKQDRRTLAGKGQGTSNLRLSPTQGRNIRLSELVKISISTMEEQTTQLRAVNETLRQEIAERRRAEEAARRSEANYRSLIKGAAYGIYQHSIDGKFVVVNPALVEMLGYDSEAELLALNMGTDLYGNPENHERFVAQYRSQQHFEGVEVEWKRKDGTSITVRLSGRPVRDEQGRLLYFEGIAENVTERRMLEEQFRQAQKMQAAGRLAGGVAHDFNNLLTVIRGYNELLLSRVGQDDPLRRNAEEIQKAADRATSLTQQLLAFSRKQVMQPKVLDLNAVVADIEKMLRRLIGEDIELVSALEPTAGRVKIDPGQLDQALMNLAVNARDAMPQGGKITIETGNVELTESFTRQHPDVRPGPYTILAVSDTGCGMDAETQSHIFEPFFTTKEKGKGTGLGLSTVYGIVRQSGGYIWVDSKPGKGATFAIYLPQVEESADETHTPQALADTPQGSETILLVEDDEGVRKLAREFLATGGYTVLEASNGAEAIKLVERHGGPIHLLVTDVVMPQMSGRELAQYLAFQRPEMKILYMSGYMDDTIIHHGVQAEVMVFLQKPFTLHTLTRKVREALESG